MMETVTGWGPYETPGVIKKLIISTCTVALLSALLNPLFVKIFALPGPVGLLTLSQQGLSQYYFWQLISYLFVQEGSSEGISLFFSLFLPLICIYYGS